MTKWEFSYYAHFDPTDEQYSFIEKEYMATRDMRPAEFCAEWLHNGGIDRLIRWEKEQYEIERMKENGENQHT